MDVCVGDHRTSLMISFLILQQCPACSSYSDGFLRWNAIRLTTAVSLVVAYRICSNQHERYLRNSHLRLESYTRTCLCWSASVGYPIRSSALCGHWL